MLYKLILSMFFVMLFFSKAEKNVLPLHKNLNIILYNHCIRVVNKNNTKDAKIL